jgi:hypothetical protein
VRFFVGRTTRDELLAEVPRTTYGDAQQRLCLAHCYVGLKAERDGDQVLARESYSACVATGLVSFIEHAWAKARLEAKR